MEKTRERKTEETERGRERERQREGAKEKHREGERERGSERETEGGKERKPTKKKTNFAGKLPILGKTTKWHLSCTASVPKHTQKTAP